MSISLYSFATKAGQNCVAVETRPPKLSRIRLPGKGIVWRSTPQHKD